MPEVPYTEKIPFTLTEGGEIFIKGRFEDDPTRIAFNFCSDEEAHKIHLHYNIRFDQETIVMNAKDDEWGEEVVHELDKTNFKKGEKFQIKFAVKGDKEYEIVCNKGQHTSSFESRMPMEDVKYLNITGELKLGKVKFNCKKEKKGSGSESGSESD